jgi:hypothetical protein
MKRLTKMKRNVKGIRNERTILIGYLTKNKLSYVMIVLGETNDN